MLRMVRGLHEIKIPITDTVIGAAICAERTAYVKAVVRTVELVS